MRSLQCGCLAAFFLGLIGATYAGQKVVVRYDQADAMQVFGVGDLKKARWFGKSSMLPFIANSGNRVLRKVLFMI